MSFLPTRQLIYVLVLTVLFCEATAFSPGSYTIRMFRSSALSMSYSANATITGTTVQISTLCPSAKTISFTFSLNGNNLSFNVNSVKMDCLSNPGHSIFDLLEQVRARALNGKTSSLYDRNSVQVGTFTQK